MASNGSYRSGLLTAGGILSIVGGALEVTFGAIVTVLTIRGVIPCAFQLPWWPGQPFEMHIMLSFIMLGAPLLVLGIIAIVGGIYALRRSVWGLALAGAICAFLALPGLGWILAILAIIFVSLGKREFS